ncbi:MFS transporter [Rhodococcus wratislaviensis]|uniref:MFS transporter n=1 Tax=Rhodococcus wratislaviensis TaxID=44752 RepID=UPI000F5850DE|nr:MFS transporter [Rhodococcus wratislaviensis]
MIDEGDTNSTLTTPRTTSIPAVALLVLALSTTIAQGLARFSFGPLLPAMREDIVRSYGDGGLLATIHMIGYLTGALVSIAASRRLAADTLVKCGMLCTAGGLAFLTFGPVMAVAAGGLFLTGAGGALVWLSAPGLATAIWPRNPGRAIGIVASSMGVGIAAGSGVPAILSTMGDWRIAWGIETVLAVIILLAGLRWLPRVRRSRPDGARDTVRWRPDTRWAWTVVGYATFSLGVVTCLTFFVAALRDGGHWDPGHASASYAAIGVAMIAGGIVSERLSRSLGRLPTLAGEFMLSGLAMLLVTTAAEPWVTIAAIIVGMCMSGTAAVISADLHDRCSPQAMTVAFGLMFIPVGIGQILGPHSAGWVVDRTHDPFSAFIIGGAVMIIGAIPLAVYTVTQTVRDRRVVRGGPA